MHPNPVSNKYSMTDLKDHGAYAGGINKVTVLIFACGRNLGTVSIF